MKSRNCQPDGRYRRQIAVFLLLITGCASWPRDVETSLQKAGENRGELERALMHYKQEGERQKLLAAQFLIANMDGHGYIETAFYDNAGHEVEFDALAYANLAEAQAALDVLEAEHGELDYGTKLFSADLESVTCAYLVENIDLAFQAWRESPWAQDLSFSALLEFVLGYRGDNEPVDSFRRTCLERYADLPERLTDPTDVHEAAALVEQDVHRWVPFDSLYYLHPTDQSFSEMNESRRGRCGDISNMILYAMRSLAIPAAIDFTPWWAHSDNNHAWNVVLDSDGRGSAPLAGKAAKVYRKTFALQRDTLPFHVSTDAKLPRFLDRRNYIDVTAQYQDTTDVSLVLEDPRPVGAEVAYLCVFNGGKWRPIHWCSLRGHRAVFTKMGRNIAYLPAYYVEERVVPAGPPFILNEDGDLRVLAGGGGANLTIDLVATKPESTDPDTQSINPKIVVKPGSRYELLVWQGGWKSLGTYAASESAITIDSVPAGVLYWLVEENSRRLERIFTVEAGEQVWW